VDVSLTVLRDASHPVHHRQRLLMYHGTKELMAEVSLLQRDELRPGEAGMGQLFLTSPLVALEGDRFILRVPSPAETVAGGVIIDMAPRRHRRRDPSVVQALAARAEADASALVVLELAKHPFGLDVETLATRVGLQPATLTAVLAGEVEHGRLVRLGARWVTREAWERLSTRLTEALRTYHKAHSLRRGMSKEELRSKVGIPADLLSGSIARLVDAATIADRGGDIALSGHRQGLTPEQESAVRAFLSDLEEHPFNPPPLAELARRHRMTPALLQYLVSEQRVVRINDDTVFARAAYEQAVSRLTSHLAQHRTLTVAVARDVLGSSRRYVLPLLEWLDAQKITRRVGDDRILRD
jgi:selenocysteine-specific elongation factor